MMPAPTARKTSSTIGLRIAGPSSGGGNPLPSWMPYNTTKVRSTPARQPPSASAHTRERGIASPCFFRFFFRRGRSSSFSSSSSRRHRLFFLLLDGFDRRDLFLLFLGRSYGHPRPTLRTAHVRLALGHGLEPEPGLAPR